MVEKTQVTENTVPDRPPSKWGERESDGRITRRPDYDIDGAEYEHKPQVIYRRLPDSPHVCVAIPPGKRATPARMAALQIEYDESGIGTPGESIPAALDEQEYKLSAPADTSKVKTKPVPPLPEDKNSL